jgi:dinuclear metal center YbgI/SA1388 family protein
VGLLLGDPGGVLRGVGVTLDPSLQAMRMASEMGCSALVAHHPLFFSPIRRLNISEGVGACAAYAIRHGLSVFALHTNWDSSPIGVNSVIARKLGLQGASPLVPSRLSWGSGAVGTLAGPMSPLECGGFIKNSLMLSRLELHGATDAPVVKIALCGGSGGALWREALACGVDAFFTADMKYHDRLDALEAGLRLFVADHGEMENFTMKSLADVVSDAAGERAILLDPVAAPFCMI